MPRSKVVIKFFESIESSKDREPKKLMLIITALVRSFAQTGSQRLGLEIENAIKVDHT